MGGAERGQRLVPDVFDELEGSWGQAAIHVKHKGNERAALLLRVGSILYFSRRVMASPGAMST